MRLLRPLDEVASRFASSTRLWLAWPPLFALACATAAWTWRHPAALPRLVTNKVTWPERVEATRWAIAGLGAVALVYLFAIVVERLRVGRWAVVATAARLNRWLAFTLALPFVAVLRSAGIEKSRPIWTVVLCAAAALAVAVAAYGTPGVASGAEDPPAGARRERIRGLLAAVVVLSLASGYAWMFSRLSIVNHHALNTRTIDLGYYDNIFYQSIHGRPLGCTFLKGETHLSAHFDPLLVLLSPIYLLRPRAELILALQSVWVALGTIPLYLVARRRLQSRPAALAIVFAYTLYPALHGANLYEFHSLTLITPLVIALLYFLEIGAFKRYAATAALLLLVREDVPLLLCFVGAYALLERRPGNARAGWLTILVSISYFAVVRKWVMPTDDFLNQGAASYGFAYYFSDFTPNKQGIKELVLTVFTNPTYALSHAFTNEKKILFLLLLLVPFGFLPLFAKRARIMLFYGLFFCLAATREPVFTIHFQYSCLVFPIAFAITPAAIERLTAGDAAARIGLDRRRLVRALSIFMIAATALLSWKFGAIAENASFRGGFSPVARKLDDRQRARYEAIRRLIAMIEPGASVATTNQLGPHVSNRRHVYLYHQNKQTDYVLINDREVTKNAATWHNARLAAGALEELGSHETYKLFRVRKDKDVSAAEAGRRAAAPAASARPPEPPRPPPPRVAPPGAGELVDDRPDPTDSEAGGR
jgi:uncharacterized membrane protein